LLTAREGGKGKHAKTNTQAQNGQASPWGTTLVVFAASAMLGGFVGPGGG